MLAYLDAGSASVVLTAIAAFFGTIVMFVRSGWTKSFGRLGSKSQAADQEKADAAAAVQATLDDE